MSELPLIVFAEDDDFAAELMVEMLQGHYALERVNSGDAILPMLESVTPALVILDMAIPGLSALEVCQRIRSSSEHAELPVIILADKRDSDNRLQVYEIGGNDYITKPIIGLELLARIKRTLLQQNEREQFKAQLHDAFSVAMIAMSSAAEVGAILQLLRNSLSCRNYQDLAREILSTTGSFGLEASVQIRGQQPTVSLNSSGPCSTLEETILATMSHQGRLVSFSNRTACSFQHVTLIIKDMPKHDPERYGRMSDNVALLTEAVDARVIALDNELAILHQKNNFAHVLHTIKQSLLEILPAGQSAATMDEQAYPDYIYDFCDKGGNAKIQSLLAYIQSHETS